MPNQTLIISILVAVVVLAALFWRSKREERNARMADDKRRGATGDALRRGEDRTEPGLADEAASDLPEEEDAASAPAEAAAEDLMPSEEATIYREIEEEERRREAEAAETEGAARETDGSERNLPPVDPGIEWVLDISPKEGREFSWGGVDSLAKELDRLELPLRVRLWAQNARDGLYYEAKELSGPARHVVASVVLANRRAKLDPVMASTFYQALDQAAAQHDVALRRQDEPEQATQRSQKLMEFIRYYDVQLDLQLVPTDPAVGPYTFEAVNEAALAAGLTPASGRWEFRAEPTDTDPVMTLAFGQEGGASLIFAYDIALGNLGRGDLQRFFALANHLANALRGVMTDRRRRALDAAAALRMEEEITEHAKRMAAGGVPAGSERAKLLFARG